jgi:tryptophan synthase beta chain
MFGLFKEKNQKNGVNQSKKYFGAYGGQFVPETLMPALEEFETTFQKYFYTKEYQAEFQHYLKNYVGRPTPMYFAKRLTEKYGKAKIYLKREDLNHTGAHKINNALGQALLAKHLNKKEIVAETGAGQHGVATATVCALLDLKCKIFMGEQDTIRQAPNVKRMKLLGAEVIPVTSGTKTLKDATSEAIRYWVTNVDTTHYIIGSAVGPYPYPYIVREMQRIIGDESRTQLSELEHKLPDYVIACVGGGSNAIGIFYPFIKEAASGKIKLIGVEAAGHGIDTDKHAASINKGRPGVLHGAMSYLLQDKDGQVQEPHSVSAGLDYPGIGPEHSYFHDEGLVEYVPCKDDDAIKAFKEVTKLEGIIPALETAHAFAYLETLMPQTKEGEIVLLNLSGRGDKDLDSIS